MFICKFIFKWCVLLLFISMFTTSIIFIFTFIAILVHFPRSIETILLIIFHAFSINIAANFWTTSINLALILTSIICISILHLDIIPCWSRSRITEKIREGCFPNGTDCRTSIKLLTKLFFGGIQSCKLFC